MATQILSESTRRPAEAFPAIAINLTLIRVRPIKHKTLWPPSHHPLAAMNRTFQPRAKIIRMAVPP
jgi:hypothetical protein